MKIIDIFNHVMPPAYLELVKAHSKEPGMVKRMSNLRMLWDIEHRVAMLREQFPQVQQVLTLGLPAPELIGDASQSPEFARVANDGMADMVRQYPGEFPAFVASLQRCSGPGRNGSGDRATGRAGHSDHLQRGGAAA
jgi:aminocarboxymuconate-semialdehyde decarboxylase